MFNEDLPIPVKYEALGTVVGHELIHALDGTGVQFDENGYLAPWLDTARKSKFDSMVSCIVDRFNNFTTQDGLHLSGDQTFCENMADSAGLMHIVVLFHYPAISALKIAYNGYKNCKITNGAGAANN